MVVTLLPMIFVFPLYFLHFVLLSTFTTIIAHTVVVVVSVVVACTHVHMWYFILYLRCDNTSLMKYSLGIIVLLAVAMYPHILEPQVKRTPNHKMSEKHIHSSSMFTHS